MNSNQAVRTPLPVEGVDMRKLPIGPEEAFVLSRIDGRTSEADIIGATGIDPGRVRSCLLRLLELGAIRFESVPTNPPPAAESQVRASPQRVGRLAVESNSAPPTAEAPAALYDPAELDEDVDIDLTRKRRILDVYYQLESLSHYELLNVAENADKKSIKNAYFEVVSLFHPDKYFGKKLGHFKPKLEKIFGRLTEAHDVLTRKGLRSEYDIYLQAQKRNRDLERLMTGEDEQTAEIERVRRRIEEEARVLERAQAAVRSEPPPDAIPVIVKPASEGPPSSPWPVEPAAASDPEARRKALARKFRSMAPSSPSSPSSMPPPVSAPTPEQTKDNVIQDLKRRYEQRLSNIKNKQIEHYLHAADDALTANNVISAANALRIAASLAPEDMAIAARLDDVQHKANAELADSYAAQAQYEERSGKLEEAARSYELASRGKPSAHLFDRVASCLVDAGTDLRKAVEFSRKAVALEPNAVEYRLTLARIYLAAGMKQSAVSEFERTFTLAPNDEKVKGWMKRVKRGEL